MMALLSFTLALGLIQHAAGQGYQPNEDFCAGLKSSDTISNREFDLSGLCQRDGTGYYGVDGVGDQEFLANVIGGLANECEISQFCAQATLPSFPQLGLTPGASNPTQPVCLTNRELSSEGIAKQFGYTQTCTQSLTLQDPDTGAIIANIGAVAPNSPCDRCNIIAVGEKAGSTAAEGVWGPIQNCDPIDNSNCVDVDLSVGMQILYPAIPMDEITNAYPDFGQCGFPQTGWQTRYVFECDCGQNDLDSGAFFTAVDGGGFEYPAGLDGATSGTNCQYSLYFKHRDACYAGYCGVGNSGLSGGAIFFIILAVFLLIYLILACFLGYKENGKASIPDSHKSCCAKACAACSAALFFVLACFPCFKGNGDGGSVPGSEYSDSFSPNRSNDPNNKSYTGTAVHNDL